jgi:DNA-binding NarL/FixJ family response regulator
LPPVAIMAAYAEPWLVLCLMMIPALDHGTRTSRYAGTGPLLSGSSPVSEVFLLKDVTAEQLFHAVRVVAAGEALLAPTVTRRLIKEFARQRPRTDSLRAARLATLTPRETQVLRLVAEGLSNPEIAARFTVTEETVKTHVSRVLAKLGLRDRTQAVVTAYETGLVVPGSREPG